MKWSYAQTTPKTQGSSSSLLEVLDVCVCVCARVLVLLQKRGFFLFVCSLPSTFFSLETFLSAFSIFVRVRFLPVPLAGSGEHKQLSPGDLWMCMNRD